MCPFDQWQRYGIAAKAIERLRREGEAFSILEVGANTHRLLGKLLPRDRITFGEAADSTSQTTLSVEERCHL